MIKFVEEKPEKIFLFAHRILISGECQCYIEKFDYEKYFLGNITFNKEKLFIECVGMINWDDYVNLEKEISDQS